MRASSSIKVFCVLAMALCGCNGIVIDPLRSESAPLSDFNEGAAPTAVAMTVAQLAAAEAPVGTFQGPTLWDLQPDDLVLTFGSEAQSCAAPVNDTSDSGDLAVCAAEAFWQTILVIPADRVQVGVIDLADMDVRVYMAGAMPDCGGGYGDQHGDEGTLEIVSMDDTSLHVNVTTDPISSFPTANGDYVVPRCP